VTGRGHSKADLVFRMLTFNPAKMVFTTLLTGLRL
jgi:hypothetical protein